MKLGAIESKIRVSRAYVLFIPVYLAQARGGYNLGRDQTILVGFHELHTVAAPGCGNPCAATINETIDMVLNKHHRVIFPFQCCNNPPSLPHPLHFQETILLRFHELSIRRLSNEIP